MKGRGSGARQSRLFDRADSITGSADWSGCDVSILAAFVCAATKNGRAVRLGYTRDGNSWAIGVYGDGDPYTLYCPGHIDISQWLSERIRDIELAEKSG